MNGRRRYPRFVLNQPLDGELHVRAEVTIERRDELEVIALSSIPCRPGETMLLEIPDASETELAVRVEENRACVADDGRLLHRVRLAILPGPAGKPQQGRIKA